MKKYLLPLILILCLTLTLSGFSTAIDVGSAASDRDGNKVGNYTWIDLNNAANSTGKITDVAIYAQIAFASAKVATFYAIDATHYTARDTSANLGAVGTGLTNWEVDLDVTAGDFIGIYFTDGEDAIDMVSSGHDGLAFLAGDQTACDNAEFDVATFSTGAISLYATGETTPTDLFSTYDQRIKLTIDNTKIDSDLTWFPVTVFLTSSQGEEVFAEFDADADFDKVAFTTSDEVTQIYGDCELFDDSESKAIYHIAKTAIVTDADAAGYIYMYYDNDAAHNTTYISKSGGTAAQSVWDANFKAVYHMADGASTSAIYDSTSNNNDGTKSAANQPIEVAGKVGKAQSFDGTDDYIDVADSTDFSFGNGTTNTAHTINVISKITNVTTTTQALISKDDYSSKREWVFGIYTASKLKGFIKGDLDGSTQFGRETDAVLANATYKSYAMRFDGVGSPLGIDLLINGVVSDTTDSGTDTEQTAENGASPLRIGSTADDDRYLAGEVAEVRISSTNRSNAWLKATYNSLYDTLLTYGAEEEGAAVNAIFFGCNF